MSRRNEYLDGKVYIGGLPDDASSEEIEDAFRRYGKIRKVWVARRPPGFAFVEFEDSRDAEDAVKSLDGTKICGVRAKVELSHGRSRGGGGGGEKIPNPPVPIPPSQPIQIPQKRRSKKFQSVQKPLRQPEMNES
ncbi:hypothetical protein FO519_008789 [Halicephalobus sp. NKZ332]|nr:hypothetical protein FO519_008789 [Halicephalobus sp. NKZ332]